MTCIGDYQRFGIRLGGRQFMEAADGDHVVIGAVHDQHRRLNTRDAVAGREVVEPIADQMLHRL